MWITKRHSNWQGIHTTYPQKVLRIECNYHNVKILYFEDNFKHEWWFLAEWRYLLLLHWGLAVCEWVPSCGGSTQAVCRPVGCQADLHWRQEWRLCVQPCQWQYCRDTQLLIHNQRSAVGKLASRQGIVLNCIVLFLFIVVIDTYNI